MGQRCFDEWWVCKRRQSYAFLSTSANKVCSNNFSQGLFATNKLTSSIFLTEFLNKISYEIAFPLLNRKILKVAKYFFKVLKIIFSGEEIYLHSYPF